MTFLLPFPSTCLPLHSFRCSVSGMQASLNAGMNLSEAVQLPDGEDLNEWLAMHGARRRAGERRRERETERRATRQGREEGDGTHGHSAAAKEWYTRRVEETE